jgi:hypothetical protein
MLVKSPAAAREHRQDQMDQVEYFNFVFGILWVSADTFLQQDPSSVCPVISQFMVWVWGSNCQDDTVWCCLEHVVSACNAADLVGMFRVQTWQLQSV